VLALSAILLLTVTRAPFQVQSEPLRDVSLFGRASKFANLRLEGFERYAWLDNHSVLVGLERSTKPIQFESYDKRRSKKVSHEKLNKAVAEVWDSSMYGWHLSPDKNRLLLVFRGQGYVVGVDGSDCHDVDATGYHSSSFWLGDSRRWIHAWHGSNGNMLDYPDLTIHDAFNPTYRQKIENNKSNPLQMGYVFAMSSVSSEVVTVGRYLRSNDEEKTSCLAVYRRSLKQKYARTNSSYIDLSLHGKVTTVALSPDCRRLAVIQNSIGLPFSNGRLKDTRPVVTLWISQTDGSNAKIVGCFFRSENYDVGEMRDRLKWLPDGKRLSFVYRRELYTVSANGDDFGQFVSPSANRKPRRSAK
jgi:hypothetical protein